MFPDWVLAFADVVAVAIVGLPAFLLILRYASPKTAVGSALRMVGWVAPCLVALQFRGDYGPAFRLALMRPGNRPARRFADRIERSAEIRAYRERSGAPDFRWISEQGGLRPPRFNAIHMAQRGFLRLSDGELVLRNSIMSRAIRGDAVCVDVMVLGANAVDEAILALPPNIQERWFALNFTAVLAEVRGTPPIRQPDPKSVEALAEMIREQKAKDETVSIVGASKPQTARVDCVKIQRIYAAVVDSAGGRPGLDRALVAKIPNVTSLP